MPPPTPSQQAEQVITEYRKRVGDFERLDEQGNDERFGLLCSMIAQALTTAIQTERERCAAIANRVCNIEDDEDCGCSAAIRVEGR